MIRANRIYHLLRCAEATKRGAWYDPGKSTTVLREWLLKHRLVAIRQLSNRLWGSTTFLQLTPKGQEALDNARHDYERHGIPFPL